MNSEINKEVSNEDKNKMVDKLNKRRLYGR